MLSIPARRIKRARNGQFITLGFLISLCHFLYPFLAFSPWLELLEIFIQAIKTLVPKAAIMPYPFRHLFERLCFQAAWSPLRIAPPLNQPRILQHLEMTEIAGRLMAKGSATSVTVTSPERQASKNRRRVGSASADRTRLSCSSGIYI